MKGPNGLFVYAPDLLGPHSAKLCSQFSERALRPTRPNLKGRFRFRTHQEAGERSTPSLETGASSQLSRQH